MKTQRVLGSAAVGAVLGLLLLAWPASAEDSGARSGGYSYVRVISGDATVQSKWNGRVDVRRNMPISAGDEISVSESGRVEIALADGNVLQLGGGTRARFDSLYAQQGEDDTFSAIHLDEGSVILAAVGFHDDEIPRIDTDDATVYLNGGSRARVNTNSRRGTVVIDRNGPVEVRTPAGAYKLRTGQYLMVNGDEDAEVDRGAFSRDRFDLWAADRLDALSQSKSASSKYVDPEYATDVEALDGYGDWDYSPTYGANVWSPRVDAGWTPYSVGSWYYTPAGLTWWSNDPWGWQPFHYGNWFFEASWNRWCWSPANVYSPAWVYWAYTPSYVGWCPVGYYSGYSPWWGTYYRNEGFARTNVYLAINGNYRTREVDFRGWNFTGSGSLAGGARAEVIPGTRIGDRLGANVAISSRPIVVPARSGDAREAVRNYVREAPRVIERTAGPDAASMGAVLARERTLPPDTLRAMRERAVVADRGRLSGPGAAEIAPRGTPAGERGRVAADGGGPAGRSPAIVDRGRAADSSGRTVESAGREPVARARAAENAPAQSLQRDDWRSRGRVSDNRARTDSSGALPGAAAERSDRARAETSDWRSRRRDMSAAPGTAVAPQGPAADRPRSDVPPARRVVDGAVRRDSEGFRERAPREDRNSSAPSSPSAPRVERAPAPASAAPPRIESRPAPPPPRVESRPAPPPAPAPRAESRPASPPPERPKKD